MLLVAGLYASVSRGPWPGFAMAIVVTLLTNPPRFARLLVPGVAGFVVALQFLPVALISRFVNLLPFVGAADQGSETYRQLLFEKSLLVIERNLLFGSK
ncbi:O-antigen ligase family protein, partial [Klebsiella pneumoniae]|uniref:O-antigen ligase family protein n=1 Tax=Klebsiella pneumoniae TaxID=573 RepID=UPI002F96D816